MSERKDRCPICNKDADAPYRVYFEQSNENRVLQGCVAEFHTGHLSGQDLEWHNREDAVRVRKHLGRTQS